MGLPPGPAPSGFFPGPETGATAPPTPSGVMRSTAFARGSATSRSPFDDSPWRKEHGALWDIGPHALSLLVPALVSLMGHWN